MAKTKSRSVKSSSSNTSLDMMSVTVLLVMAIFGGIVGFYLGKGSTTSQSVMLREAAALMKDKGMMVEDAGRFFSERGNSTGDREMMDKGQMLMDSGSTMMGKGDSMMGMTQDY